MYLATSATHTSNLPPFVILALTLAFALPLAFPLATFSFAFRFAPAWPVAVQMMISIAMAIPPTTAVMLITTVIVRRISAAAAVRVVSITTSMTATLIVPSIPTVAAHFDNLKYTW